MGTWIEKVMVIRTSFMQGDDNIQWTKVKIKDRLGNYSFS